MVRIFPLFAALAILLLAANFFAGLWIGDFNAAARERVDSFNAFTSLKLQPGTDEASLESARQQLAAADAAFIGPRQRMTIHMLLGSTASLATVLVTSVAITYFIGVSRWSKEVVDAYGLPQSFADRMSALKRRIFRWGLVVIATVIGLVSLGAAADPSAMGAMYWNTGAMVQPHFLASMLGTAVICLAFWMQWQAIQENFVVLEEVMSGVRSARAARGLPTESSPVS